MLQAPRLTLRFDPVTLDGDLSDEVDHSGVETEALIATATDRRVDPSELPEGVPNRGWWADSILPNDGEQIGSAAWLLQGVAATEQNLARAEARIAEALAPIARAGRIASFRINAMLSGQYLEVTPVLVLPDGSEATYGVLRVN